jgi:hypothetical protein
MRIASLFFLAALLTASPAEARIPINAQGGCDHAATNADHPHAAENKCAAALEAFDATEWRTECDQWEAVRGEKPTLLHVFRQLKDERFGPRRRPFFHAFARGRYLLEMPCNLGAYNRTSLFFRYDERQPDGRVEIVDFPQFDGRLRAQIWSRAVSTREALIFEYVKERGLGDSGAYARYRVDRRTLGVRLVEAIVKSQQWDEQDPFQWTGRLSDKPRGAGWRRRYPPAP